MATRRGQLEVIVATIAVSTAAPTRVHHKLGHDEQYNQQVPTLASTSAEITAPRPLRSFIRQHLPAIRSEPEELPTETVYRAYCPQSMLCPKNAPVAFVAVPRSGCSSVKKWVAEVDGGKWLGHDNTTFRCCSVSDLSPGHRLPVMVSRHPITRAVSIYNHGSFFCLEDRWELCSKPLSISNIHDFKAWFTQTAVFTFPRDANDGTLHFRSQASWIDPRWPLGRLFVVHLEDVDREWTAMLQALCTDFKFCTGRPFPSANRHADKLAAAATSPTGWRRSHRDGQAYTQTPLASNNYSLIFSDSELLETIRNRYAADFETFGYSIDALTRTSCISGKQLTPGVWRPMTPDERVRVGGRCKSNCGPYGDQHLIYEPYQCALNYQVRRPHRSIHLVGDSLTLQSFHAIACATAETIHCSSKPHEVSSSTPDKPFSAHKTALPSSRESLARLLSPHFSPRAVAEAVHQLFGAYREDWRQPLGITTEDNEDEFIKHCWAGNVTYTRLNRLPASKDGAQATLYALTDHMSSDDLLVFNNGVWPASSGQLLPALQWAAKNTRPQIIYRDTLPQHFTAGTGPPFKQSRCASKAMPRLGLSAEQLNGTNAETGGRLTMLPAWEVLQNRSGEHRMQSTNPEAADCTHYCGGSSSLRYLAAAILNLASSN